MNSYSKYWESYYKENKSPNYPSNFAKFCKKNFLKKKFNLLEIGAGNGRDSIFFTKHVNTVYSLDKSQNAIKIINNLKKKNGLDNLNTIKSDVYNLNKIFKTRHINFVYMRWFLHSIDQKKQEIVMKSLSRIKNKPFIAIEVRTSKDTIKFTKNTRKISDLEYLSQGNHYRRLIDKDVFFAKVQNLNFKIIYEKISSNFSNTKVKHSNAKPNLLRLLIRQK